MLASILRTPVAAKVSVSIMRTFVMMRKYISNELIQVNLPISILWYFLLLGIYFLIKIYWLFCILVI